MQPGAGAGALAVRLHDGVPTAYAADEATQPGEEDLLQVVYDCGPVQACPLLCMLLGAPHSDCCSLVHDLSRTASGLDDAVRPRPQLRLQECWVSCAASAGQAPAL